MDRFRKSHLVALALALMVIASTSSALAAGRRPTNRGIESGGTPEQEVTGDPEPGVGGLPSRQPGTELVQPLLVGISLGIESALLTQVQVRWLSIVRSLSLRGTGTP